MANKNEFEKLKELIKNNRRFIISSHVNVEPDALGSELAFASLLRVFGKDVKIINDEDVPTRFKFMPGAAGIIAYKNQPVDFDVAVILDCSDLNRIGRVRKLIDKHQKIVNIDHHISNVNFGHINIVDGDASSASEIVYGILKNFGISLNKDIAFNLYCGILTDTGSFRYSSTSSKTFMIASQLVGFGLDVNKIYREVYKIDNLSHVKIIGRFLQEAKAYRQGKVIYLALPDSMHLSETLSRDLAEEALSMLRLIYSADVFVLMRKLAKKGYIRMNLRSNSEVNVNKIARAFNGGGHKRAASATVKGGFSAVKRSLLKEIDKYL